MAQWQGDERHIVSGCLLEYTIHASITLALLEGGRFDGTHHNDISPDPPPFPSSGAAPRPPSWEFSAGDHQLYVVLCTSVPGYKIQIAPRQ